MRTQRVATQKDGSLLWDLRTRAVREACASHYQADQIERWCAASPPESFPRMLDSGGALVTEEEGRLLGYAILDFEDGKIAAVFVDPVFHGRGIGKGLLQRIQEIAVTRGLGRLFLSASLNAIPFYQRVGFEIVRHETYRHRCGIELASAYMTKHLNKENQNN